MSAVPRLLAALAAGLLFGLGLSLSGMLDPARVQSFLDVTGAFDGRQTWDPTLAFVLGGAVSVAGLGYALARRLPRPALAATFDLPTNRRIDRPLIGGAALFGIGWGLSGLCPGPAVAALSTGALPVAVFVAAMLVGMVAHHRFVARA
ncbi:YeeE/YedE family protein [Methylobacterium sp. J-068]|uniref:YeeE/YedE family protein n=1 Tax=Methylobacterium sp. J-068 TaxID=2836649 RepID=UPI001FBB934F|nr:YeeE/YedE family protein [Methylobacterium sp. J-068]MCJ2035147.1 YeeE/YedE family protein [Methylobacterium sp. J-068]